MRCFEIARHAGAGAALLVAATFALADDERAKEGDAPRGAYMASQCTQQAQCPLFDEVYATTPPFRHALALAMRHGDKAVPDWVKDKLPRRGTAQTATSQAPPASSSTASPMLPLRIDERSYLLGNMSDPQDARHRVVALYDTQRGIATLHYVDVEGKAALLGDDAEILPKVMTDYLNTGSDFARSLSRPELKLPVPIRSN